MLDNLKVNTKLQDKKKKRAQATILIRYRLSQLGPLAEFEKQKIKAKTTFPNAWNRLLKLLTFKPQPVELMKLEHFYEIFISSDTR